MALILHAGLRDSGLDYPALSDPLSFFFLCVFVIVWLSTKATVPELCQAAEKYVCTLASTTCFYWKPRYWGKCLEFPRSSGFGESQWKGGTRRRGNHIHSVCHSPLKPLCCQEMHSNSIWNTNEIKGSSPPAGEHTDQWMPLCTEGATERRLRENEKAVSGACGNRRDRDYEGESLGLEMGNVQNGILTNILLLLF